MTKSVAEGDNTREIQTTSGGTFGILQVGMTREDKPRTCRGDFHHDLNIKNCPCFGRFIARNIDIRVSKIFQKPLIDFSHLVTDN